VNLLIGLAVLALILVRQLQVRPVRASFRLPLILAIIGVVELYQFLQHNQHHHNTGVVFAALAGSLALAAITGAIRALTVRVWFDGGRALRQGNWLTAVLWIVSLGAHLGYDYLVDGKSLSGLGTASLTLYFAVTYTIQRLILQAKAQRLADAPQRNIKDPGTRAPSL
jgi:threonine/homoserine efflux transporter RhtA